MTFSDVRRQNPDQGGPPDSTAGLLSYYNGAAVIFQQGPRCTPVRPLQQNKTGLFIAQILLEPAQHAADQEVKDAHSNFANLHPWDFYFRILQGFEGICRDNSELLTV